MKQGSDTIGDVFDLGGGSSGSGFKPRDADASMLPLDFTSGFRLNRNDNVPDDEVAVLEALAAEVSRHANVNI